MYKFTTRESLIRISDGAEIPINEQNSDYQKYLLWLSEGNEPLPADPEPIVLPTSVTMRQARLALLQVGLLANVEAAIASIPGIEGDAARIEWEYAITLDRYHSLTMGMAQALQLTEQQLDDLFVLANSL